MTTVAQAFELALQLHQSGRIAEAEGVYRQILAALPNHPAALHLLGVVCHQTGRVDLAASLIRQSISLNPKNPAAHSNLGEVYRSQGRFDDAIASYRSALDLKPDHAEALYNLGNAFQQKGQHSQAADAYRGALRFKPDYVPAHVNLGAAHVALQQFDQAVDAYQRALALAPNLAEIHNNLGAALMQLGRFNEAATAIRRALELKPNYAEAFNNLGAICAERRSFEEAVDAYGNAITCKPDFAEALTNLGNALREAGRLDEAIIACRRAVALKPEDIEAHNNLGAALRDHGEFDAAIESFRYALALDPDYADARFNSALLLLLLGDFEKAWPLYETRWQVTGSPQWELSQPKWDGQPLHGQSVLVRAEQGFGDAIHFIRYAPLIADRGGQVIVECPPTLVELFRSAGGVHAVIASGAPLPAFDFYLPMLSQPLVFQTRHETIPAETPYLFADPARRSAWRERLDRRRLNVGLTWAGHPQNRRNQFRNISFDLLLPLLELADISFVSLQLGEPAVEARDVVRAGRLVDETARLHDFAHTAALVAELDLVITVDTAVAHLAGALGRPVWTLLPWVPDWRWGIAGDTTPWYPTMRLFRQPRLGDWDTVLSQIISELRSMAAE